MKLILENPNTGIIKKAPVGFSCTTFFFAFFPALFRGDMKYFLIQLVLCLFSGNISSVVFAFVYNKLYIENLLEKGFKVRDVTGGTLERAKQKLKINFPVLQSVPQIHSTER